MAIPMLALATTAILLGPALFLLLGFTKPGVIRYAGMVVIGGAFFPLVVFLFQFLLAQTVNYGFDVSSSDVPGLEIPIDATDISYYSRFGPTRLIAQFAIAEDGFRNWMEQNGRSFESITHPEDVIELSSAAPPTLKNVAIKSGYRWDDYDKTVENDDSGTTIVFDQTSKRVYICTTHW